MRIQDDSYDDSHSIINHVSDEETDLKMRKVIYRIIIIIIIIIMEHHGSRNTIRNCTQRSLSSLLKYLKRVRTHCIIY